nr:hypothetical protein [Tolypothrix sp. PCC 7910]
MESHNGQINMISDPLWGTEFNINLPITQ